MRILISLISDQPIPNIIGIKECVNKYDKIIFITTEKMEEASKSHCIENSIGIKIGSTERLVVNENSIQDITIKLSNRFKANNNYLINITGGTKLMSMTVYNFFKNLLTNTEFIYLPINKGHIQYFGQDEKEVPVSTQLNLKEYLLAYGINIISYNNGNYDFNKAKEVFEEYRSYNYDNRHPNWDLKTNSDIYYKGGWFEDYCYYYLKEKNSLSDAYIMANVKVSRDPDTIHHENEFDIIYVNYNELYVFECKYSLGNKHIYIKVNTDKAIYKLGAITRNFGLKTNSYIITLTDFDKLANISRTNFDNKCTLLNIKKLISLSDFKQNFAFNL